MQHTSVWMKCTDLYVRSPTYQGTRLDRFQLGHIRSATAQEMGPHARWWTVASHLDNRDGANECALPYRLLRRVEVA